MSSEVFLPLMNNSDAFNPEEFDLSCNPENLRIGIVRSRFNQELTQEMLEACLETLVEYHLKEDHLHLMEVPGAFEIPLAAKLLIETKNVDGVVALGCLIRGETPHFDFVASACSQKLLELSLEKSVPVGFGVITALTLEQAKFRAGRYEGNYGKQVTCATLEMIQNIFRNSGAKAYPSNAVKTIKKQ